MPYMTNHDKQANEHTSEEELEGLPPFAKTWKQLYIIVIAELVALIGLFYWFTKAFE